MNDCTILLLHYRNYVGRITCIYDKEKVIAIAEGNGVFLLRH